VQKSPISTSHVYLKPLWVRTFFNFAEIKSKSGYGNNDETLWGAFLFGHPVCVIVMTGADDIISTLLAVTVFINS